MYDCKLKNLNEKDVNQFKMAWRKIKWRIWKISPRTHNNLVCNITNNIDTIIDKRLVRFIYNSISTYWYINIDHLMGKLRKKMSILYPKPMLCNILLKFCAIRDNITTCDIASITDIIAIIKDLCTNN